MDVTECENCGGIVVFDAARSAVRCVFCGDVSLTLSELTTPPQPKHALLYEVGPEEAQKRFRAWARRPFWAPRAFRNHPATIETVWVPAWRVEAIVHATWTGLVAASTRSGKRPRSGEDTRSRHTWVPASLGLSQEELTALAPFPEVSLRPWAPDTVREPYEVGGLSAQAATIRARDNFCDRLQRSFSETERLHDCRVSVLLHEPSAQSFMLPLYVGCVRFRDRPWRFVVNGATGTVTGRTPISRVKVAVAILLVIAAVLAIAWWSRGL